MKRKIVIEHGIKISPIVKNYKRVIKEEYPLSQMLIGDSIFIPGDNKVKCNLKKKQTVLYSHIWNKLRKFKLRKRKSQFNISFVIRSVKGGYRVWRTT